MDIMQPEIFCIFGVIRVKIFTDWLTSESEDTKKRKISDIFVFLWNRNQKSVTNNNYDLHFAKNANMNKKYFYITHFLSLKSQ